MASRASSLRAMPSRLTHTSLTRRDLPILPQGARYFSSGSTLRSDAAEPTPEERARAKADKKAAAAERSRQAEERWIAKLQEEHGNGWRAVYEESKARKERNAAAIREAHRQGTVWKGSKAGKDKASF